MLIPLSGSLASSSSSDDEVDELDSASSVFLLPGSSSGLSVASPLFSSGWSYGSVGVPDSSGSGASSPISTWGGGGISGW